MPVRGRSKNINTQSEGEEVSRLYLSMLKKHLKKRGGSDHSKLRTNIFERPLNIFLAATKSRLTRGK